MDWLCFRSRVGCLRWWVARKQDKFGSTNESLLVVCCNHIWCIASYTLSFRFFMNNKHRLSGERKTNKFWSHNDWQKAIHHVHLSHYGAEDNTKGIAHTWIGNESSSHEPNVIGIEINFIRLRCEPTFVGRLKWYRHLGSMTFEW